MHCTSWNIQAVPGRDGQAVQTVFHGPSCEGEAQGCFVHAALEASVNCTLGLCRQNHPRLCLAAFIGNECACQFVVGMYLDRQTIVRVEKFDKQGKLRQAGVYAKQIMRLSTNEAVESPTAKRAAGDG